MPQKDILDDIAYTCMLAYPIVVSHLSFNFLCLLLDYYIVSISVDYPYLLLNNPTRQLYLCTYRGGYIPILVLYFLERLTQGHLYPLGEHPGDKH